MVRGTRANSLKSHVVDGVEGPGGFEVDPGIGEMEAGPNPHVPEPAPDPVLPPPLPPPMLLPRDYEHPIPTDERRLIGHRADRPSDEVVFLTNGGKITRHSDGYFVATCPSGRHGKCTRTKKEYEGENPHQGCPLGFLAAWILACKKCAWYDRKVRGP